MGSPKLQFRGSLSTSDPRKSPVLIVGQLGHLTSLSFSDVAARLQPRVDEEVRPDHCLCCVGKKLDYMTLNIVYNSF